MNPRRHSWFSSLRALVGIATNLRRCAEALERIADHYEGKTPPELLPEPEPEELVIAPSGSNSPDLFVRYDQIERELYPLLGRQPTPEEILQVYDGVEWTAADAEARKEALRKQSARVARRAS